MDKQKDSDAVVLLTAMLLYCLNRFVLKPIHLQGFAGCILHNHFNDYLGAVVFISYTNILIAYKMGGHNRIRRFVPVLCCGALCAALWEGLLPLILPIGTADIYDCLAYMLGALSYWLINGKRRSDG